MSELIELNSPGTATGDHDTCSIQRPKPDLEYGETLHLRAYVPASDGDCDCPVEYAWYVDGRSSGSDEVLVLEERPDAGKRISVKLEARRGSRSFEAKTELLAYPFVTNNFAVLLREKWEMEDSGVLEIEAQRQLKLSTRILNPTSHDLSFSWRVNGNEVMHGNEEYRVFSFIPSIFADAAGRVEVAVSCVNAGLQSSDTMEIRILA